MTARDQLVLWSIRIPRIAAAAMVGGLLAASGAIMQGLFRNPLADPALVGVSTGGAFAAAGAIVFTDSQIGESLRFMQNQLLPLAAFFGLAGDHHRALSASPAVRDEPRLRSSCWRGLRSPPSPMPASGFWCSSPTTASCATSPSGCWDR